MVVHATKVAVVAIVIVALGTLSKNTKARYGRLNFPDIFWNVKCL